ncbi:MAG: uridine kinase [Blastocatellia bacterium]|nr:MAG: uridine kinase [Blastocatellia bacterium]
MKTVDLDHVAERIIEQRKRTSRDRGLLVGISGIDASGKGYITKQLETRIAQHTINIANINVDGWLNLPRKRFSSINAGEHFYNNAIRFDDFFTELLLPLRDNKSIDVVVYFAEENATEYQKRNQRFANVSIALVEGIFLFKREYRLLFDLAIWVDCSFRTALARAIKRQQEGLPRAETIRSYETIYFPAQRLHMDRDQPRKSVDLIINNDQG